MKRHEIIFTAIIVVSIVVVTYIFTHSTTKQETINTYSITFTHTGLPFFQPDAVRYESTKIIAATSRENAICFILNSYYYPIIETVTLTDTDSYDRLP